MREPETGELSHRMVVRIRHDTPKGSGLASQFTEVAKRWVKVEPLGTATYTGAKQTGTEITHRLYCRFLEGLDTRYELAGGGRVFRVKRPTAMRGRAVWSVIEVEELGTEVPTIPGGDDVELGFD